MSQRLSPIAVAVALIAGNGNGNGIGIVQLIAGAGTWVVLELLITGAVVIVVTPFNFRNEVEPCRSTF